jgi:hypothetical protein
MQHVFQVEDVRILMSAIDPVRYIACQVAEIGIPYVLLDRNVLELQAINFRINAFFRTIFVPGSRSHLPLAENAALKRHS